MKTKNISYFSSLKASVALSVCAAISLSGCATTRMMAENRGSEAELRFRLVTAEMPAPRFYWSESPRHAETMLTITPTLPGCDAARIYINPSVRNQNSLNNDVIVTAPIHTTKSIDPDLYWANVTDKDCAVLVLAISDAQSKTEGLWVSTEAGQEALTSVNLPESNPDDDLHPSMVPFMVLLAPMYLAIGGTAIEVANVIPGPDTSMLNELSVSFEFQDERVLETTLGKDEAINYLKGPYYIDGQFIKADAYNPFLVRYWIRAAILKLDLDFREESANPFKETEVLESQPIKNCKR